MAYQARTIWRGKRQSAAKAFLRPAMQRPNLTVASDTEVLRIVFDGRTAVGVEIRDEQGIRTIRAGREVILCAGALESPKLLQLSGVGPGKLLRDLDIAVVHDQPQVGQNLREHFYLQTKFRVSEGGLNHEFAGLRLLRNVLRYLFTSAGPMSHAAQELVGYIRSRDGLPRPDCQIGVGLYSLADGPRGLALETEPGFTIGGYYMHPRSRGETFITSPDPAVAPYVDANYLAEAEDRIASVGMVRAIRHIAAQPALAGIVRAELAPGPAVQSDDAILDDLYARGGTAFHVSGTCRMGSDDAAVTDPAGRVRGVAGLRVVDTSLFPELPSGNTNAPAMAAGRNVARMMLAER
ncbi:GMC family oxidoreductase [Sphingomonas bacterium]|uniref:GMC family oxidoreductase n=1 Tax=Sphingomonas bacterium TaxID=1895847 RepID=UPI0020C60499